MFRDDNRTDANTGWQDQHQESGGNPATILRTKRALHVQILGPDDLLHWEHHGTVALFVAAFPYD